MTKSAEYTDLIIRIACRSGHGGCAVRSPRPLQGVVTPVSLTQSLLSPSYVLRGQATTCT